MTQRLVLGLILLGVAALVAYLTRPTPCDEVLAARKRRQKEEVWAEQCMGIADKLQAALLLDGDIDEFGIDRGTTDAREFAEELNLFRSAGPSLRTVCITSFGAGLSALAALCASNDTAVYSFDSGAYTYVNAAQRFVNRIFGASRHKLLIGDPKVTLPIAMHSGGVAYGVLCDTVLIGAGRRQAAPAKPGAAKMKMKPGIIEEKIDYVLAEVKLMASLSTPGARVVVERCHANGKGAASQAYQEAVRKGWIVDDGRQKIRVDCNLKEPRLCHSMCVGHYSASVPRDPLKPVPPTPKPSTK